jgi:regulator of cell morphogenesis and NO signaling
VTSINLDARTLADIVATTPGAARLFDRLGLDYCCHGDRSLGDACAAAELDPVAVRAQLDGLPTETVEWTALDAPALADHIVATHHRYLDDELPLLDELAAKVLTVHGDRHPELREVRRLVTAIRAELEPHLRKEEQVLFPAIRALAARRPDWPFGSFAAPIAVMTAEHEAAGELLDELRTATAGYAVPAHACASYRSLYERLEALVLDTHLHIHKENHALFPAALRLAQR